MPIIQQYKLKKVKSVTQCYAAFARQSNPMPNYLADNLDALADFLSTDLSGPCQIVWYFNKQPSELQQQIFMVLQTIANQRDDLQLIVCN